MNPASVQNVATTTAINYIAPPPSLATISNPSPPENLPDASPPSLTSDSTTSAATSDPQLAQLIKDCSRFVWNEPVVRDMQLTISDFRGRAVYHTGSGKTHIVRIIGTVHHGVVLILNPLLSRSANVQEKFQCGNKEYSPIHVDHLDELFVNDRPSYYNFLHKPSSP